jgi:hypothetical protein
LIWGGLIGSGQVTVVFGAAWTILALGSSGATSVSAWRRTGKALAVAHDGSLSLAASLTCLFVGFCFGVIGQIGPD